MIGLSRFFLPRLTLVIPVFAAIVAACSPGHEVMRGSVVMMVQNGAHICLGSEDGVRVGELLTIYRTKEIPLPNEPMVPDGSGRYQPRVKHELVKVGMARVTAILGEHYAAIELIEGELEASDIVEKQRRP